MEDVRAALPAARRRRVDGRTLHVYNVHLGTAILERRHQAQRLAAIVSDRHVTGPKLVLGDFNEWMRGLATTLLSERLNSVDLRDFPAGGGGPIPGVFPLLHLDHIYYAGHVWRSSASSCRGRGWSLEWWRFEIISAAAIA